jgi:uncharacterized protein with FMN-binding domain
MNLAKKVTIGFAVLIIFGIYSVGIRHVAPVLTKPASLKKASANNSASSGSGTPPANGNSNANTASSQSSSATYKDGTYTGSVANAYYGNVQVRVIISGGKITDVKFLQYPNSHTTSVIINQQVMPYLKQETIQAQSANVQLITGATFTSQAFVQSLQAALRQA